MGRSDLSGQALFWKYDMRFLTPIFILYFFKLGSTSAARNLASIKQPLPSFDTHILNRLDMRIHQVASKMYHTYKKQLRKSRLSDPFLGFFGHF